MRKNWLVIPKISLVETRRALIVLPAIIIFSIGFLSAQYILPTNIVLSYATNTSCVPRLVAFSDTLRQTETSPAYKVSYSGGLRIGPYSTLSTRVCVTPTEHANKSEQLVQIAPLGLAFLGSSVVVSPEQAPAIGTVRSSEIAITTPLVVSLSSPDVLHTYNLHIANRITTCANGDAISCQLNTLELKQGKSYDYQLERKFNSDDTAIVANGTVDIIDAVTIKSTSIKNNQTIYDRPGSINIGTNKLLSNVKATLLYEAGDTTKSVPLKQTIDKKIIKLVFAKDLPREKKFTLKLSEVTATDGSTLLKPYVLKFRSSGGPQVTGSSLGSVVSSGTAISIYFNQPISPDSIVGRVTVNGKSTTATVSGNTLSLVLPSLAQCTAVNIEVSKGVVGTKNKLKSANAWSATSRAECGSSNVIGYSVHQRPLIAYYFGTSGGTTTLFTGGIHGSEPSGYSTMDAWISYLRLNAHRIPSGKQIVVIPNMNPDGIAANTRLNAHDVNLDRNYPTNDWKKNISTVGGYLVGGGGSSPASEPETKAAIAAISSLSVKLAISYHAQGSLVGSNNYGSADAYAQRYSSTVGYGNMSYNAEETMGYTITGEFEQWLAERGVPAILIELPTQSGNYLPYHQDLMWSIATE